MMYSVFIYSDYLSETTGADLFPIDFCEVLQGCFDAGFNNDELCDRVGLEVMRGKRRGVGLYECYQLFFENAISHKS